MNKKIFILADHDGTYLDNLANFFMEKEPQLELCLFTKEAHLDQYLNQNQKVDILVIGDSFAEPERYADVKAGVKILLSSAMSEVDGFELVKKYQKTEALLNEIMLKYAEHSGNTDTIRGNSSTKLVSVYSPAGGCGCTTISLSLASVWARHGWKTLYLNFEEISSLDAALPRTAGNMSDLYLALKTRHMNVGVKLQVSVGREESSGVFYLSGVDSVQEYEEISGADMEKLIEVLYGLSEYDVVIADISSGISSRNKAILGKSDLVLCPIVAGETAVAKLMKLSHEKQIHDTYDHILQKLSLVANRVNGSGVNPELLPSELAAQYPCCMAVPDHPIFQHKQDLLRAGASLEPLMNPAVELIRGLWK